MRRYCKGFTIIELLTVVSIILLLLAILLPALSTARRQAKDVNASAHLHSIETALEMFQNERGGYPSSNVGDLLYSDPVVEANRLVPAAPWYVSGMHLLAEALIGRDQLGFDPTGVYDPVQTGQRVGPLVKLGGSGAVGDHDTVNTKLDDPPWAAAGLIMDPNNPNPGSLVLLDPSYGMPVLYYHANRTGQTTLPYPGIGTRGYYFFEDNRAITGDASDLVNFPGWDLGGGDHKINDPVAPFGSFDVFITNPKIGNPADPTGAGRKPYNNDSFLLLSAGYDKIYGTADDIRNWTLPK